MPRVGSQVVSKSMGGLKATGFNSSTFRAVSQLVRHRETVAAQSVSTHVIQHGLLAQRQSCGSTYRRAGVRVPHRLRADEAQIRVAVGTRGCSSIGGASPLHGESCGFDSCHLHHGRFAGQ